MMSAGSSSQYQHQAMLHQSLASHPPNNIDQFQFRSALAQLSASSPPQTPSVSSLSPASSSAATDGPIALVGGSPSTPRPRRPLDRSASEPIPSSNLNAAALLEQASLVSGGLGSVAFCRYKTELCRPFEENGSCKYADKCQFAHGRAELRAVVRHPKYKTDLCRTYHTTGLCPYGPRCHFIHNDEERRLNEMNRIVIEQKHQQQRAVLIHAATAAGAAAAHQQQEVMSTMLTQRRLQTNAAASSSSSSSLQQKNIDQAIASSLQRSLSLGNNQRVTAVSSHGGDAAACPSSTSGLLHSVRSLPGAATTFVGGVPVAPSAGCGRGSVDSVASVGSSLSPQSSSSSPSSSDVESPMSSSFQRLATGRQHHAHDSSTPSSSPEHFSFPQILVNDPSAVAALSRQLLTSSDAVRQSKPSADTAIMLALLARRVRDAEWNQQLQQQNDREDDVRQLLTKWLQSSNASSSRMNNGSTAAALESTVGGVAGRCCSVGTLAEQQWALLHGATASELTRM